MLLVQKWQSFQLFFRQYRPGKCLLKYSENKKRLSRLQKQEVQKVLTHGFGPKMAIFPPFFLGNIGQKNVFYDILEGEKAFLGYKDKKLKKVEKLTFFQRG